jgi:hypothetical protein
MLDKTNLAQLKYKLKFMRQENGESTQEYLKRYSAMETEIKKEEMRLALIDNAKRLQKDAAKIKKQQEINDYIYVVSMFLLFMFGLFCCYFLILK